MAAIDDTTDYLEVDDSLPGQNFVCLSFISPEHVLEKKDKWIMNTFIKSLEDEKSGCLKLDDFNKKYDDYVAFNAEQINEDFAKENNFQTSIRGVKVRGVYNTQNEANKRASELQRLDRNFNVFVGQLGYWLPWDPTPSDVGENEYLEKELNDLMKQYKQNQVKKDLFYSEQVESKKRAALEAVEKQKKENEAAEAAEADETVDGVDGGVEETKS